MELYKCDECNASYHTDRDQCADICDECYNDLKERTRLLNDPVYRMELTRQTVGFINMASNSSNHEELKLRGFFACVMPEISLNKADKIIRQILKK